MRLEQRITRAIVIFLACAICERVAEFFTVIAISLLPIWAIDVDLIFYYLPWLVGSAATGVLLGLGLWLIYPVLPGRLFLALPAVLLASYVLWLNILASPQTLRAIGALLAQFKGLALLLVLPGAAFLMHRHLTHRKSEDLAKNGNARAGGLL